MNKLEYLGQLESNLKNVLFRKLIFLAGLFKAVVMAVLIDNVLSPLEINHLLNIDDMLLTRMVFQAKQVVDLLQNFMLPLKTD